MNSLQLIADDISLCKKCEFRNTAKLPCSPVFNQDIHITSFDLMVINDKISPEENECATTWFDRHSDYTAKLIHHIFPSHLTYFTSFVKCFTPDSLTKTNSNVCYRTHLLKEIAEVNPKAILTMGLFSGKILLRDFVKKPKIGDIFISNNHIYSYWDSPFKLFNQGKRHEEKFLKFLNKLKTTISTF